MKLQGINGRGIRIFPAKEKELQPSLHKYGAVATWTQVTDQLRLDFPGKEINAFKYNMGLHAFLTPFYMYSTDEPGVLETGRIGFGIYMQTEYWRVPSVPDSEPDYTKKYAAIPDFYKDVWSQVAVDAGLITSDLVGTVKPINYPNHGRQLFDFSAGKFGYDHPNGVPGEIDTLRPLIEFYMQWFNSRFGYFPSSASYGYGRQFTAPEMKEFFIGVRNSAYDSGNDYNITRTEANSKAGSTRQHDMVVLEGITIEQSHIQCSQTLESAILNNGWYVDFTHWHSSFGSEMGDYLNSQRQTIAGRDVVTLDYNEAIEYQFLRNMVRRIHLYTKGDKIAIAIDIKNSEDLPLRGIESDLSVEVDLTGTILEGQEIQGIGDNGIRKMSTNQFIVEVPYNKKDCFTLVHLEGVTVPRYLDFTLPTIISVTKSGDTIIVTTDKPTNVVIYRTALGGALDTATVVKRSNMMDTSHYINVTGVDFSTLDIYIGVITKEKQSVLSLKYNF